PPAWPPQADRERQPARQKDQLEQLARERTQPTGLTNPSRQVRHGSSLRKNDDFKRVRRRGQSAAHPYLVLFWASNEGLGRRIGISVSRALGGAVQRNRAKRSIRAGLQPLVQQLQPDLDIVIMARTGIRDAKSGQVQKALESLLS